MSLLLDILPADLGLPEKFTSFRSGQANAIDWAVSQDAQFMAANAPTGIGKSLVAWTVAKALGARSVYLTATKGLQDQIGADFSVCGVKDVRGKANYPCRLYTTKYKRNVSCEQGDKEGCIFAESDGCSYYKALADAKESDLISTNYSYWLHSRRNSLNALCLQDGPPVDLLICDEAHNAFEELARFLQITITRDAYEFDTELGSIDALLARESGRMDESSGALWRHWAKAKLAQVNDELARLRRLYGSVSDAKREDGQLYAALEDLKLKVNTILRMDSNWVWEADKRTKAILFDPIWPGQYANQLWSGVKRILLLSATLRPYTLKLLGLNKGDYQFAEFPNGWPPNFSPVYYLPTVKLNYRSTEDDYKALAAVMDQIISGRLDRKGIIHTVSYARMKTLMGLSRYSKYMISNESSRDSGAAAKRFRDASPPAALISPSFGTGWDFSYKQCEYQIITKVPFPNSQSRVVQERCRDESYRIYSAMLEITQMIGRGRRAHDDRCETFILDKSFALVQSRGKQYAPIGFNVHRILGIPTTPKKL